MTVLLRTPDRTRLGPYGLVPLLDHEIPDYPDWLEDGDESFWTRYADGTYLAELWTEQGMEGTYLVLVSYRQPRADGFYDAPDKGLIWKSARGLDGYHRALVCFQKEVADGLPRLVERAMEELL